MMMSDSDRQMLDLEGAWFRYPGAKERVVRDRFAMSMVAYWQRVNALIDTREALEYAPVTVRRLQRIRQERQRMPRVRGVA
jgi:hypothetical protein